MFEKARIKLTTWYLLIIMSISLAFSAFIYSSVTNEFQRRLNTIEHRYEFGEMEEGMRRGPNPLFIEDVEAARKNVFILLVYANGTILVVSGLAGYFLAGKTLRPIENAMDEQKRFVADASHELKTPLTALQTSIEVALRDKKLTLKEAKKVLKESLDDTGNLNKLANDLLSLTKYQTGDNGFVFSKVNLKEIIQHSRKQIAPLAKKKGVTIISKTTNHTIEADKIAIEKLVTILLDNAVKYSLKKGKVNVSTNQKGKNLYIKVKDKGIGIAKEDIPHVFDRFYRVDQSRTKNRVDGFGLGLSLAKKITDHHNGTVSVKSELGKGSSFTVKLPIKHS